MSFLVRKLDGNPVAINDLGITITGTTGTTFDLSFLSPEHIADSDDLVATLGSTLEVLDPRDDSTALSTAEGTNAVRAANDPQYGIQFGRFAALDAPTTVINTGEIARFDGTDFEAISPNTFFTDNAEEVEDIVGGMLTGTQSDITVVYDDANGELDFTIDDVFLRNTGDTLDSGTLTIASGATLDVASGGSFTIDAGATATIATPTGGFTNANSIVNKSFVDSISAGLDPKESVRVGTTPTDGPLGSGTFGTTIQGQTQANYDGIGSNGSFTGGTGYAVSDTITLTDGAVITVDAVSSGVVSQFTVTTAGSTNVAGTTVSQASTSGGGSGFTLTPGSNNIDGEYNPSGGPNTSGQFTGLDLSSATGDSIDGIFFTGTSSTGLVVGDRVLIKNQADPKQNGIYEITAAPTADDVTLTRAEDQDGTPSNEVSGGNFTFVEDTTDINASSVNSNTGWVVIFDGTITLNTDDVVWSQFSGAGAVNAGIGLSQTGVTIDLDLDDLTTATVALTDEVAFHDADGAANASGSQTRKSTIQNVVQDLDIPFSITASGIIARTGEDTYASRTIQVNGAGALDGLAVTNGDGVSGDPTIGLDIQNLPALAEATDGNDRVPVFNVSTGANEYYTVNQIATASSSNSFETWAGAGNTTGDISIVADSATDTATLTGGIGISIDFDAATDTVTWTFGNFGMADTPVQFADTVPFFDSSNLDEPEFRSFQNIVNDLDVPHNITANGIIVRTAADNYASRTITASVAAGEEGIAVTDGDGVAGNPTIGVDINNQTNSADDLVATDEVLVFDGTNNVSMTGQQVADGVETILGLPDGLTTSTINGQPIVTYTDSTRTKQLSVESNTLSFGEKKVDHLDWLNLVGDAVHADTGYIAPLNGTLVMATGMTVETNGNTKDIHLFVNGVDQGSIGQLTGAGPIDTFTSTTLDIDFAQGDRLRLQGQGSGTSKIDDTQVTLYIRWRA